MSEESNYRYDVFLSHSSHDKTWADAACAVLERHHIRCWIAPRDIIPGDEWGASIIKGINQSRIMVLIFSGRANDSAQVRREVDRAINQGMNVMPVRIEDVRPEGAMEFALSNMHWLDAFAPPAERHLEKIARSVRALLDQEIEEQNASDPTEGRTPSTRTSKRGSPTPEAGASTRPGGRLTRLGLVAAAVLGVLAVGIILVVRNRDNKPSRADSLALSPEGRLADSRSDDQTAQLRQPPRSSVDVGIDPKTADVPAKATVESPARATADRPPSPPAAMRTENVKKSALPSSRIIYADEFKNNRSGLVKDLGTPPKPNPGRADGVFYIYAPRRVWRGWDMHHFNSDSTCEVVGRVSGDDPKKNGAWSVLILNTSGLGRGMRVNINMKGELFVEPSPWPAGKDFLRVDPRMGPITHPAIRPGSQYNDLLLVVRKREVRIVVNGVRVCDPVKLDYDITPSKLQLGTCGPGNRWAEFDRVEIREIDPSEGDKSKDRGPPAGNTGGRT